MSLLNLLSQSTDNKPSQMTTDECLGIVGYHERAFVRARLTDVNDHRLVERIDDLPNRIGNGNNLAAALELSMELLVEKDRRHFRRIWLLTDGQTDSSTESTLKQAQLASENFININVIPIGTPYKGKLLESIVRTTHNGKYISPDSFWKETDRLKSINYRHPSADGNRHRPEASIVCLDLSAGSLKKWGQRRRIETIVDYVHRLVDLKRRTHG